MRHFIISLAVGCVFATAQQVSAVPLLVDTLAQWTGTGLARGNGSLGQVISSATDTTLTSFTFFVEDGETPVSLGAYILPWNDYFPISLDRLLYESPTFVTTNNN